MLTAVVYNHWKASFASKFCFLSLSLSRSLSVPWSSRLVAIHSFVQVPYYTKGVGSSSVMIPTIMILLVEFFSDSFCTSMQVVAAVIALVTEANQVRFFSIIIFLRLAS